MPKNGTLQSLIKGVFIFSILYIGIFSGNNAFADILYDNQLWTDEFIPADQAADQKTGYLFFTSLATSSITHITLKQFLVTPATKSVYPIIQEHSCATPSSVIGGTTNLNAEVIEQDIYKNYTYAFSSPYTIGLNKCYAIQFTNTAADENVNTAYSSAGGVEGTECLATSSYTGLDLACPSLPYFIIWSGLTGGEPSVEFTDPVASASITIQQSIRMALDFDETHPINFSLKAIKSGTNTVYYNFSQNYAANYFDTGTFTMVQNPQLANGNFVLTATIVDEYTGLSDNDTLYLNIDILNNPNPDYTQSSADQCEGFSGTFDEPLCKVAVFLFKPSGMTSSMLMTQKENLEDHIPISWIILFNDTMQGTTAVEINNYHLLPEEVNNIFKWLWYFLFLIVMYKFVNKLFRH